MDLVQRPRAPLSRSQVALETPARSEGYYLLIGPARRSVDLKPVLVIRPIARASSKSHLNWRIRAPESLNEMH